jgi:hypothetical protein
MWARRIEGRAEGRAEDKGKGETGDDLSPAYCNYPHSTQKHSKLSDNIEVPKSGEKSEEDRRKRNDHENIENR